MMNSRMNRAGRALVVAAALAVTAGSTAAAAPPAQQPARQVGAGYQQAAAPQAGMAAPGAHDACGPAVPGRASCLAVVSNTPVPGAHGAKLTRSADAGDTPQPWLAAELQSAYNLRSDLLGARQTIAIVDAYDDPNAAGDLATYRAANNLPACDTSFPCFRKVNQEGQESNYPQPDSGWAVEESLDVDMASAICPNCTILLVEADDNTDTSLGAAVNEAVKLGADVISNSYGGPEYPGEMTDFAPYFDHPGVAITAASGDFGFGAMIPAAFSTVVSVGGTSLFRDPGTSRGWTETSWTGAGSGCSAYVPKPAWQHDALCGKRTVSDVSAVADPATGVAIYDSFQVPGWVSVGGTSVASPVIAGIYALAGNARSINPASYLYAHGSSLSDVSSGFEYTSGANGDCGGSYLCMPVKGYDGPTGNGTPDGTGAF